MSSSITKSCFNSYCKESPDKWWRGWRRRTGEYTNLCDRCAAAYEEGKFCETFHLNASGWRCCESCGKQIHCGCIVSFHMFVLLDAGGIECLTCAKKSYVLTPNPAWPPPSHLLPSKPERMKDLPINSLSSLTGSWPVPRWAQAPSTFIGSSSQSDVHPSMPSVINQSGGIDRFRICERLAAINGKPGFGSFGTLQNGFPGLNQKDNFYLPRNDFQPMLSKNDSSLSNFSLATASSCKTQTNDTHAAMVSIHNGETQVLNGKVVWDEHGRNNLLPRYHPQITHEELQQIESDSKLVITPLFEKTLSASDAGRIGRLVVPKKCAEAYFPPIDHPEGVALRVQEAKGKDWVFQFRFWPNNNSRMYVLEGITPCIQSMQLQAGDVVTFSRLEPEGKLVIGGRKASTIPSSESTAVTSGTSIPKKSGDVIFVNCVTKCKLPNSIFHINQAVKADIGSTPSGIDKSGLVAKNVREPKLVSKSNSSNLGAKSKRLKIENGDSLELSVTWKEAQGLMRQADGTVPSVFVVEGWEFEEFEEEAPVIGRPTIFWTDNSCEKMQWAQCEDCFKWRKVPADALLPSRWICSGNVWDHDRSLCSAAEEFAKEQLEDVLRTISKVSPEKETTEQDADLLALEGLDTLANLAIQDEGEGLPSTSSETTTKHPRHKPGCACIVCLQPPSGKAFKHKRSCDCVVCSSMKRRFKTSMERRKKKQLEKESESPSQNSQSQHCSDSPLKGQIDLNIQPERDEEFSPSSESLPLKRMLLSDV